MFKRKKTNKMPEENKPFEMKIEVMNYHPVDFRTDRIEAAEAGFQDFVQNQLKDVHIDALNGGTGTNAYRAMFDPYADSLVYDQLEDLDKQHADHMKSILNLTEIAEGEKKRILESIAYETEDLQKLEEKLEFYLELEKRNQSMVLEGTALTRKKDEVSEDE